MVREAHAVRECSVCVYLCACVCESMSLCRFKTSLTKTNGRRLCSGAAHVPGARVGQVDGTAATGVTRRQMLIE